MLIITLIFLISILETPILGSTGSRSSGLSKGDVFYYEMYAEYRSNNSSNSSIVLQIPAFEKNNTSWIRIEITDVSDLIISHVYTVHFKDGSEQRIVSQTDLSEPSGYSKGFRGIPLCRPNLMVGDSLLGGSLTVDNIGTQMFSTVSRQVVHTSWNSEIDYGECSFDRQTGFLMGLFHVHLYVDPQTNYVVNKTDVVKLIGSNF